MALTPLNALNEFLTVARRQSFAAAAQELGVSASALSQAVRQLEARLGVTLLARTTRSVALTEAGRQLVEQAGPGVAQALGALRLVTDKPNEPTGSVRLTVPTIASSILVPLLRRFGARHPRILLDVRVEDRFVDIVSQGFDAGVRLEEFLERDMVSVRLSSPSRFVVVGSPEYLERHGEPRRPKDLLTHTCIGALSSNTGAIYPWELERGKKLWKVPVRGSLMSNAGDLRQEMAEAGMGLTYTFEPLVQAAIEAGRLRIVMDDYAAHVPGLFLYYPSRERVSPAFRAFVEVAKGAP
jgi:DNA-binding transcriptional LysR family regulator